MEKSNAPLVLLLGGASGTGKTTLANALVQELGLVHHVSTGFVREVARAVMPPDKARMLVGFSFDAWRLMGKPERDGHGVFVGALAQARLLQPAIEACIRRSLAEGASLVLEGAHVMPGLFDTGVLGVSLLCILDVPNRETLVQRALGPTHSRRHLSQEQIASILELQDSCVRAAREHGVPVLENTELSHTVAQVKELLARGSPS
jgi:2-phosphoglycerate kinase